MAMLEDLSPKVEDLSPKRRLPMRLVCAAALFFVMTWMVVAGVVDCISYASASMQAKEEFFVTRRLEPTADYMILDLIIRFVVFVVIVVCELLTVLVYWHCYIKPFADQFVPRDAIVPDDLKGKWQADMFACNDGHCGTCCCYLWCTPCAAADFWYKAGWIHGTLQGTSCNCVGWQFFAGIFAWCALESFAGGCMPCVFAILRGGVGFVDGGDGGLGDSIKPLRQMFGIPHNGWNTFCEDCCCFLWCSPCVFTQEYRQILALVSRAPLQVQARGAPGVIVVGQPVALGNAVPYDGTAPLKGTAPGS